VLSQEKN